MATTTSLSAWWPISFGIASLIFFIAGGALLGTWAGCYLDCSAGNYYGGIALVVIAFFFKIAWIVTLVLYIRRRRYAYRGATVSAPAKAPWNASTGLVDGRDFSSSSHQHQQNQHQQPSQYSFAPPAQTQYSAAPVYDQVPAKAQVHYAPDDSLQQNTPGGVRYCLKCGATVHTPFCAHCGSANPI